jgi:ribokinase
MTGGRVLVVGSINADDTVRLERMPRPGETVNGRSIARALGGKGANQAVAASRAGKAVQMIGAVGSADGSPLIEMLDAERIETSGIARVDGISTGRAIVLVDDHAENLIVVVPGANAAVREESVEFACTRLTSGDVILLQNEVPTATSQAAARYGRAAGATVLWNAAPAPNSLDELVADIDMLVVNEHELVVIAELLGTALDGSVEKQIHRVADRLGADVICTLGAEGAAYCVAGETGRADASRVNAIDTTAAGDTFVGYLAATAGLPFNESLRMALTAGSITVTRQGAAASIPFRAEVESSLAPTGLYERTGS